MTLAAFACSIAARSVRTLNIIARCTKRRKPPCILCKIPYKETNTLSSRATCVDVRPGLIAGAEFSDCASLPRKIFVIDGFNLLFRAYYALVKTSMTAKDMFDTRAVYGFANTIVSLLRKHVGGDSVVVVFEGERKPGQLDHRRAAYPEYKSDRKKTPAGIIAAIPWVKRLVIALGIPVLEEELFEADDVIGTFVKRARDAGIRSVIVSVDKDFLQLLDSEYISILKPGSKSQTFQYITEESFRSEFSDLHPSKFVDVLTLIGDTVDSIKGVPGVGPKTAPQLIKHFGSLENLMKGAGAMQSISQSNKKGDWWRPEFGIDEHDEEGFKLMKKLLTKSRAENLLHHEQRTVLMKSMVAIRTDVNLPLVPWSEFCRKPVNEVAVEQIWRRLEFESPKLFSRLLHSADDVPELSASGTETDGKHEPRTQDPRNISATLNRGYESDIAPVVREVAKPQKLICSYIPLDKDDVISAAFRNVTDRVGCAFLLADSEIGVPELRGIAVSTSAGCSYFIDCLDRRELPPVLVKLLQNRAVEKAGWFLKEGTKALLNSFGIFLRGRLFDLRVAADLVHGGQFASDAVLVDEHVEQGALDSVFVNGSKRVTHPSTMNETFKVSDIGFRLAGKLKDQLEEKGLNHAAELVEFPLISTLAEMELRGVPLKIANLRSFEEHTKKILASVEQELRAVTPSLKSGHEFRPTSNKDVAEVLFETWKLPLKATRTRGGSFSTNKTVLQSVADDPDLLLNQREFGRLLLHYREVRTILRTSTQALLDSIRPDDRVRCTFVQDASPSGRLSTSQPNLQAIPVRSQLGRELRRTIAAPPGFGIMCADYSQIELRILASLSQDKELVTAFANGDDVHTAVAAAFFDLEPAAVTSELRTSAKKAVYGILYGMTARGLSNHLQVSTHEAQTLISLFQKHFSTLHDFTLGLVSKARDLGFARTMSGRQILLPALLHGAPQERRAAERVAINFPIQGTQADMIKIAMARIATRLREGQAKSHLILQLHDELVLEVADDERSDVELLVRDEMSHAFELTGVPIVVNVAYGETW